MRGDGDGNARERGEGVGRPRELPQRALRRWTWWSGCVLLGAAVAALFAPVPKPLLLLGDLVVPPSVFLLVTLVLGVACWWVCWRSWREATRSVAPTRAGGVFSVVATVVAVPALFVSCGIGLFAVASIGEYRLLKPASPDACRLVSERDRVRFSGTSGRVYLAVPGSVVLRPTGAGWWSNFEEDSKADPIDDGQWSLTWDGSTGHLRVWGQDTEVSCPVPHR